MDLAALQFCRLTCKHLSESLAPQVLGSITLDINQDTIAKEIPKLKAMAGEKIEGFSVNIRNHLLATRELTIRGVSPTFDPSYRCTWSYRNGVSIPNGPGLFVPSEAWMADEEVEKYLGKAIARMRGVRKVRCPPLHISVMLFVLILLLLDTGGSLSSTTTNGVKGPSGTLSRHYQTCVRSTLTSNIVKFLFHLTP